MPLYIAIVKKGESTKVTSKLSEHCSSLQDAICTNRGVGSMGAMGGAWARFQWRN